MTIDGLHYIHVDVETSGTQRGDPNAHLLSIGAVVMDEDAWVQDTFYARIDQRWKLGREWYDRSLPTDSETLTWWRTQDPWVMGEAIGHSELGDLQGEDDTLEGPSEAAHRFHTWLLRWGAQPWDRVFVANPSAFDYGWVADWLMYSDLPLDLAFSYRPMDLRSVAWGMEMATRFVVGRADDTSIPNWGDVKCRVSTPTYPHHPLSDAFAQAQDQAWMMGFPIGSRITPADEPWYPRESLRGLYVQDVE